MKVATNPHLALAVALGLAWCTSPAGHKHRSTAQPTIQPLFIPPEGMGGEGNTFGLHMQRIDSGTLVLHGCAAFASPVQVQRITTGKLDPAALRLDRFSGQRCQKKPRSRACYAESGGEGLVRYYYKKDASCPPGFSGSR